MDIESLFDQLLTLASVDVDDAEREKYKEDIGSILGYVEQLQKMDLGDRDLAREAKVADSYREDTIVRCPETVGQAVRENFPALSGDGLVEAHGALSHK